MKTTTHNRTIRLFLTLLIALWVIAAVLAPRALLAAGQSGFPLLKQLNNPFTLSLGGAVVSLTDSPLGWTVNPALAGNGSRWVYTSYAREGGDMWSGSAAALYPINDRLAVAATVDNLDYGDFAETGLSVGATGNTFHAADFLFSGTVGWKYNDQTLVGGTVKYAYSVIGDYSGAAAAVDLGVAYDPRWKDIKLGMTVRNLGKQTDKFGSSSFPLPTEIVIGGSRRLQHMPLTLNVAAQFAGAGEGDYELSFLPSKPTVSFSVGGEFAIKPVGAKNPLHLRLGYQSRADALHVGYQNDLIAGFSLGFGMVVSKFNIDYVYAPMGAVGDVHRFGIMFAY